jgi:hypothetical protein
MRSKLLMLLMFTFFCGSLFAQAHVSVPLDNQVYYILEQAQIRGLCAPLSGVKPYSQSVVISAIDEILDSDNAGRLTPTERSILEQYLEKSARPKVGFDWTRGSFYSETVIGEDGIPLTADIRAGAEIEGSSGNYLLSGESLFGYEIWVRLLVNGDLGRNLSYELSAEGGLMKVPRQYLGEYNTYYAGFEDDGEYQNRKIKTYSEPLTHFPYTYKKRWDGSIYFIQDLYSFESWPVDTAGAYNLGGELTLSLLNDKLITRISRMPHEWGSVSYGSSMHLNQAARPFIAMETEFNPLSWFSIATMTGILEYYNAAGIKDSAMNFQNAYSITLLQFRYKNYFFLDLGEMVVWPKRFELGYMLPIISTIFYQNNIGDFDNMAAMLNLKLQYPGIGNIWASLFWDEAYWVGNFYELDRTMLAGQAGMEISLPFLSFSSLKFSYTKINPYTYTHNRNYNPWYGNLAMETSYTNNGVSLGYYLPPNSVEYLARFKTALSRSVLAHLQYQLIQHGADFGSSAVDGSNLLSELDPDKRDGSNPVLKRFFLHDGAYQWMHIIKAGVEWNLPRLPVTFFGEAGAVISYFSDTVGNPANSGQAYDYEIIDTSEYPRLTGIIVKIGFRLYPR